MRMKRGEGGKGRVGGWEGRRGKNGVGFGDVLVFK